MSEISNVSRNRKLKVTYDKKRQEINIFANKEGLEYLSEICKNIGRSKIGEHYHFSSWTQDIQLTKDSLDLVIWLIQDVGNIK